MALDPNFAIVHRNLALAYARSQTTEDRDRAITELEKAVAAPRKYALHFAELDEFYAAAGAAPEKRLALLEENHAIVAQRDDALSREIGLLVFAGKYDQAIKWMTGRRFSVWEGGSLEVAQHWVNAHELRGRNELERGNLEAALSDFQMAKTIPENLPNDRGETGRAAELCYWIGSTYERMGKADQAVAAWREAVEAAAAKPVREGRVSEQEVQGYFVALAQQKLGRDDEAEAALQKLLGSANKALEIQGEDTTSSAGGRRGHVSVPAIAHYVAGLGHLGLAQPAEAKKEFQLALQGSPDLLGAKVALAELH